MRDLESVVFYDKPLAKFDRLARDVSELCPTGLRSFRDRRPPIWLKEKLYLKEVAAQASGSSSTAARRSLAAPVVHRTSPGARRFGVLPEPF